MLNKVIEIVREAGCLMQNRDFVVESKGTISNNVTTADLAVQDFLESRLTLLIDHSVFIGEEGSFDDDNNSAPYRWIMDPIDGTANFIHDMGLSVISVALIKGQKSVLGVIYHPYRDEMFYAEEGKGAFLNGKEIQVSDRDFAHSLFCSAASLYNKDYAKPCFQIMEKVYAECDDFRRLGSAALELVYLACGRVDLYFEIRLFPWDFAAGEVIIREAGGYVGTIEYPEPVYHRPIPFICANSKENYEYLRNLVLNEIPVIPYNN